MDSDFTSLATLFQTTGPYGFLVVFVLAFLRINQRKNAILRDLYDKVEEMERAQTAAMTKIDESLHSLKAAVESHRDKTS